MKKKKATKAAAPKRAGKKPATPKQAKSGGTYTPKPVQGNGWAPFRYPPQ
jgi:hypothetical protein